jgi:two-component system phosphate regulon response regulator PhoB
VQPELDTANQQVICRQTIIDLTPKENTLLAYLMHHPDRNISRETIINHAWNESSDITPNSVDVCIKRLREKLSQAGIGEVIQTVPGAGYRFQG